MSLNQLIIDTLAPLNVLVDFATYDNSAHTYIVFSQYNEGSGLNADDNELVTKYFYQADIFSKVNNTQLVKDVKRLMKEAGFIRIFASDVYEKDMKMYRKILRFTYESEIGEE
jgi:hypothetical protein